MNLNIDLDTATNALEIFNIITNQFGAKALDKDQANNELKKYLTNTQSIYLTTS